MRDLLAATAAYLIGGLLLGPALVGVAPSLAAAVLLLALLAGLLAVAAGALARRAAGPPGARRLSAAGGVCLGTFLAVLAGAAALTRADASAGQLAALAPMAVGLLALLPAAALAEWVARRPRPAAPA